MIRNDEDFERHEFRVDFDWANKRAYVRLRGTQLEVLVDFPDVQTEAQAWWPIGIGMSNLVAEWRDGKGDCPRD